MEETHIGLVINRKLFYIIFIIFISVIVYSNTFQNGFYVDDTSSLLDNPNIRTIAPISRFFTDVSVLSAYAPNRQFRPFLPLTFSINYAISKYNPASYHIFNLACNIISAILLFLFIIEIQRQVFPLVGLTRRINVAFIAAVLFVVHPATGITINYVSNRDLVMMQMFLTASFLLYVRMRGTKETVWGYVFAALMLVCSILSKTNSVVSPLLILAYELTVKKASLKEAKTWLRILPFCFIVFSFFLYTKFYLHFSDIEHLAVFDINSILVYFPTQVRQHLFVYLMNFIYPFNIHMEPSAVYATFKDPLAITGLLFIAGSIYFALKTIKTNPLISFCIFSYWIMMLPESSFMTLHEWRADYRPFASSPYLYMLFAAASYEYLWERSRKLIFALLLAYFSISSFVMNRSWIDGYTLWSYSMKKGANPIAIQNLGLYCSDIYEKKKCFEQALSISPNYLFPNINYALTLASCGQAQRSIKEMQSAVKLEPNNPLTHYYFAKMYEILKMNKEAYDEIRLSIALDPDNLNALSYGALLAQYHQKFEKSVEYTTLALKKTPGDSDLLFAHGFGLQMLGRLDECIAVYRSLLLIRRNDPRIWYDLGIALKDKGSYKEAVECFNKTLDLKPDYDAARPWLIFCYNKIGDNRSETIEGLILRNK